MSETQTKCDDRSCFYQKEGSICTRNIRLFKELDVDAQAFLTNRAIHRDFSKGAMIKNIGDPMDSILIIRSGRLKTIRIDADGEEHILDILHDGQAIWHDMFLAEPIYHYSVAAVTDVSLCIIRREDFLAMLEKKPKAAFSLIAMLSTELQEAKEQILLLSIREPRIRLAGFLLDRDHKCIGPEIHLRLEDIASAVSLRPETVSRNLKRFENEGLIERRGNGRLLVIDRNGLTQIFKSESQIPKLDYNQGIHSQMHIK